MNENDGRFSFSVIYALCKCSPCVMSFIAESSEWASLSSQLFRKRVRVRAKKERQIFSRRRCHTICGVCFLFMCPPLLGEAERNCIRFHYLLQYLFPFLLIHSLSYFQSTKITKPQKRQTKQRSVSIFDSLFRDRQCTHCIRSYLILCRSFWWCRLLKHTHAHTPFEQCTYFRRTTETDRQQTFANALAGRTLDYFCSTGRT